MSNTVKVFEYNKCSNCKNALKFLNTKGVPYKKIPIVETPPSLAELKKMLGYLKAEGGTFKNLFNTSGVRYRELNVAQKIKAGLTEQEALQLLSQNGKLIKRPFLLTEKSGAVGFQKDAWENLF